MINLRPYQEEAVNSVKRAFATGHGKVLVVMATGCHLKGQQILKYDGGLVNVEDIRVGDQLMGPDGSPRNVTSLVKGNQETATIHPVKGDSWVVNLDHVLTLVRTQKSKAKFPSHQGGQLIDISVCDWLTWSRTKKHIHKLVRSPVKFNNNAILIIDPYVLGCLIGDGSLRVGVKLTGNDPEIWDALRVEAPKFKLQYKLTRQKNRCASVSLVRTKGTAHRNQLTAELDRLGLCVNSGEKFVPFSYKTGSYNTRREILAGLIDTDGHLGGGCFDFISKSKRLADDTAYLARSIGLAAYVKNKQQLYKGEYRSYWRTQISGDLSIVPCRLARKKAPKREQIKDVLRTGFSVELGPASDYYGFSLDGDKRYLLGDFTVTHNTGKTSVFAELMRSYDTTLLIAHRKELIDQGVCRIYEQLGLAPGDVGIEMASRRSNGEKIIVGSVQTILKRDIGPRDLIVIDEAHHAVSNTYQEVLARYPNAHVLGVTATPDRADKVALGSYFQHVAYKYETSDAIRDGWLVPVKTIEADGVDGLLAVVGSRRTIVFTPNVAKAIEVAGALPGARYVHGDMPMKERDATLAAFKAGEFQFIVNCNILTEGFDAPEIECVAMLRATQSRGMFMQCLGRGLRLSPYKHECLYVDLTLKMPDHSMEVPGHPLDGNRKVKEAYSELNTLTKWLLG